MSFVMAAPDGLAARSPHCFPRMGWNFSSSAHRRRPHEQFDEDSDRKRKRLTAAASGPDLPYLPYAGIGLFDRLILRSIRCYIRLY